MSMRKFLYILTICLFIFSCGTTSKDTMEKSDKLTQKQIEYAQQLRDRTDAIKVEWNNNLRLFVTYDSDSLVKKDENDDNYLIVATATAGLLAKDGYEYTGQDICVYIFNSPSPYEIMAQCYTDEGLGLPKE